MASSRPGSHPRFAVVVLVLICLTLITVDSRANHGGVLGGIRSRARDVLTPAEDAVRNVTTPLADTVDGILDGGEVEQENRRLRAENDRLRGENAKQADSARELQALLDAQKLDTVRDIPRVAARVINSAPSNLSLTVEIDRGSGDGILPDMPVVNGAGLVGKVVATSAKRAQVLLLLDPQMDVGGRLAGTSTPCLVQGQGVDRPLFADLVKPGVPVGVDEVVVTSGLQQSRYPKGIPVGRVAKVDARPGVAYQAVDVVPAVDFDRLEFVDVLLTRGEDVASTPTTLPGTSATSTTVATTSSSGAGGR